MVYLHKQGVYEKVPLKQCLQDTGGRKPIGVRWLDTNKRERARTLFRSAQGIDCEARASSGLLLRRPLPNRFAAGHGVPSRQRGQHSRADPPQNACGQVAPQTTPARTSRRETFQCPAGRAEARPGAPAAEQSIARGPAAPALARPEPFPPPPAAAPIAWRSGRSGRAHCRGSQEGRAQTAAEPAVRHQRIKSPPQRDARREQCLGMAWVAEEFNVWDTGRPGYLASPLHETTTWDAPAVLFSATRVLARGDDFMALGDQEVLQFERNPQDFL